MIFVKKEAGKEVGQVESEDPIGEGFYFIFAFVVSNSRKNIIPKNINPKHMFFRPNYRINFLLRSRGLGRRSKGRGFESQLEIMHQSFE